MMLIQIQISNQKHNKFQYQFGVEIVMQEDRVNQQLTDKQEKVKYSGMNGDFFVNVCMKDESIYIYLLNISTEEQFGNQFSFKALPIGVQYFLEDIFAFGRLLIQALLMDNVSISKNGQVHIEYRTKLEHENQSIKRTLTIKVQPQKLIENQIPLIMKNRSQCLFYIAKKNKQVRIQNEKLKAQKQKMKDKLTELSRPHKFLQLILQKSQHPEIYFKLKQCSKIYEFIANKTHPHLSNFTKYMRTACIDDSQNSVELFNSQEVYTSFNYSKKDLTLDSILNYYRKKDLNPDSNPNINQFYYVVGSTQIKRNQISCLRFQLKQAYSNCNFIVGLTDDKQSVKMRSQLTLRNNKTKKQQLFTHKMIDEIFFDFSQSSFMWWFRGCDKISELNNTFIDLRKPLYPFFGFRHQKTK